MSVRLTALLAVSLLLAGCGATVTTQVVPVALPLPTREEAVYQVQDKNGAEIGRATLAIAASSDGLRLTQAYIFGAGERDESAVIVDPATMRPRSSERGVIDGDSTYRTTAVYQPTRVTVTFTGKAPGEKVRGADISETAYDNLESLFLWRTITMGAGETVSYVNIVVDPKRGTISRALATVSVSGREEVKLASGTVEAWRVDFTSAGVTNQAWYAVDGTRRLVKYTIARGPTLLLERVAP